MADLEAVAEVREALEGLVSAVASMPDARLRKGDPGYRWWWKVAVPALDRARAALAAPPEADA